MFKEGFVKRSDVTVAVGRFGADTPRASKFTPGCCIFTLTSVFEGLVSVLMVYGVFIITGGPHPSDVGPTY